MINWVRDWWPPSAEDDQRLRDYARREQLYRSQHALAFARKSAKIPKHLRERAYLVQDYPRLITSVYAELLYGKPPVFSLPGQQPVIDNLVRTNRFHITAYENELATSYRGDGCMRISIGSRWQGGPQQVMIEEIPAHHYFVERDPHNYRRILSQCLAWEYRVGDGDDAKCYLLVQTHYPGLIINQAFLRDGHTKVKHQVKLSEVFGDDAPPEEEKTRVPVPLLYHFPNERDGSQFWGDTDYTIGLESLFDEANGRITGMAHVIDKHQEPVDVVPPGTIAKRGYMLSSDKVIEVAPEDAVGNVPRKLTWDGQLDSGFRMLEAVEEKIFQFSYVSPAMFGKDKAGNIESGRAMIQRFARMMTRGARKQSYREPVLVEVLYAAQLLAAAWFGAPDPLGPVEVVWRNGLPKDDTELTEVAVQQVAARLMSHTEAIRYIRQVGEDEAQAAWERIQRENPAPATPQESSGQQPEVVQAKA